MHCIFANIFANPFQSSPWLLARGWSGGTTPSSKLSVLASV